MNFIEGLYKKPVKKEVRLSVPEAFILPVGDYDIPEEYEEQRIWGSPVLVPKNGDGEVLPVDETRRVNL